MKGKASKEAAAKGASPKASSGAGSTPRTSSAAVKSSLRTARRVLTCLYAVVVVATAVAVLLKPHTCERLEGVSGPGPGDQSPPEAGANGVPAEEDPYSALHDRLYSPISAGPTRFLLYRMIGNDMPPLQCNGQLFWNTRYTLENEAREFPECRKIWVLNNIINDTERAFFLDLLMSHGYSLQDILIRRIDYAKLGKTKPAEWTPMVTAQNEARNFMLEHGLAQQGARWILPFDGNQFFTNEAWDDIRRAANLHENQGLKYFKVPMFRLYHEQRPIWLWSGTKFSSLKTNAPYMWESQIAFRNDSTERYNEGLQYGKDNKLELIDRVCGTAKFDPKDEEDPTVVGPADRKQCGCHHDVGNDRKVRPFNPAVANKCGYSVRLWYFPCKGVRTSIIFTNPNYRRKLRKEGHDALTQQIQGELEKWVSKVEHLTKYKEAVNTSLHVDPEEALEVRKVAAKKTKKVKPKRKQKQRQKHKEKEKSFMLKDIE